MRYLSASLPPREFVAQWGLHHFENMRIDIEDVNEKINKLKINSDICIKFNTKLNKLNLGEMSKLVIKNRNRYI